jgi:hypothetical protein
MKVIGDKQLQMGTDFQFVPVQFSQSIDTMLKDHMMCSLYSNPHPASFCLGAAGCTDPELARILDLDA